MAAVSFSCCCLVVGFWFAQDSSLSFTSTLGEWYRDFLFIYFFKVIFVHLKTCKDQKIQIIECTKKLKKKKSPEIGPDKKCCRENIPRNYENIDFEKKKDMMRYIRSHTE